MPETQLPDIDKALEKKLKKELKKFPRKKRKRLRFLWEEYNKGNVLKIVEKDGKISR